MLGRWAPAVPLAVLLLSGCAGGGVECAPYARQASGVMLRGDAADWWAEAAGRYARSSTPQPGSVLVFRRSGRLPYGHVSTVSRVLGPRNILVDDANWVHGRVTKDEPVVDVSAANDWTLVRVWWAPSGRLGITAYPTYGFVGPAGAVAEPVVAQN